MLAKFVLLDLLSSNFNENRKRQAMESNVIRYLQSFVLGMIFLVVFKSTPIFKRAMMVKHGMFQLYLLKVIKVLFKFQAFFSCDL